MSISFLCIARRLLLGASGLCFLAAAPVPVLGAVPKWDPVDPAELANAKPQVDPEAGAEILLREEIVDHSNFLDKESRCYVRAKIYSERGLDDFTKIEIPSDDSNRVTEIAARTIRPNGTIVELNPKDVFDREVVRFGHDRYTVKSFAPPGLEPGAIVEYRYLVHSHRLEFFLGLVFQSKWPARIVRYRYRPMVLPLADVFLRSITFHMAGFAEMVPDKSGYILFERHDLAALKDEPFQPPEINSRASVLLFYTFVQSLPPEAYWKQVGADLAKRQRQTAKPNRAIQELAGRLAAPADAPEVKLRKLYDYCRTSLRNRDYKAAGYTAKERAKLPANETAADTLKHGSGTGNDVNVLFAALAQAAGLDARFALCNRRNLILFSSRTTEPFMVTDPVVAVKLGDTWRYFDPGAPYLDFGTLPWPNSATAIIVADPDHAHPNDTFQITADQNQLSRLVHLELDATGTVEGEVTVTYAGQRNAIVKDALDGLTAQEQETYFTKELHEHLPAADLTRLKVENATDPLKPLRVSYHLRVPDYADRTGTRLFFQPAVFQKNIPAWFSAPTRNSDVIFRFPYVETDEIHVTVPEDFALEQASAPLDLSMGQLGQLTVSISHRPAKHEIIYERSFRLNGYFVPRKSYDALRTAFEGIRQRDAHTLTLKRVEAQPEAKGADASVPVASVAVETPR